MQSNSEPPGWEHLGDWWLAELASDPAYEDEVTPMLLDLATPHGLIIDLGCGEGRLMSELIESGCTVVGVDVARSLLMEARTVGPVVLLDLPSLGCFRDAVFDGALISLVLEHIPDHRTLFNELARVVAPGGFLALLVNHPIYTAPGSAPIELPDGEVLWRSGLYLSEGGYTDEPAGESVVRFHHRPLGVLVSDASAAGWDLERMVETGVTASQIERHPPLSHQQHIPRLLGIRWVRR